MTNPALEDILETLLTAVVRIDAAARITYLNPAAADLLETSPRHARGRALADILPVDEALPGYVDRAITQREPLAVAEMDLWCGPPPGRRRRVACDILPLEGNDGAQLELKALDQRQLAAQLAAGESGLDRNLAAQRLLFQALAHEVKNPLSGMRGAAQLLAAEIAAPPQREYLDVMLREIDRLRDLVDALLGPARAPRLRATNVHELLEHVCGLLSADANATIGCERDYDPSLPELDADPDQLTQVLLNLVVNARDSLASDTANRAPRILLRTRIERNALLAGRRHRLAIRVDVEDNGPGVPAALRESLFLPLITGRADGTGLGLAIARDIVERHAGAIEWHSEPARTVFSVLLPLTLGQGPRQ